MRSAAPQHLFGTMCLLLLASVSPLLAQGRAMPRAAPVGVPSGVTAKERLAEKWTDEQRLDNCKVPPDKRGSKPRPDTCPAVAAGSPSVSAALAAVPR